VAVDAIADSYDSKEVILDWWDDDPIEIHDGKLQLPQFTMTSRTAQRCTEEYKTGSLNYIVFHKRRSSVNFGGGSKQFCPKMYA